MTDSGRSYNTPEARSERARKAANARWAKEREEAFARAERLAGTEIHIKRENEGYTGRITSLDGRTTYWATPEPVTADELIGELQKLGWHQTDIGEICPHGRPIVKRLSLLDLLRDFGRL